MHSCTACGRTFSNKGALTRHEQNHHKTSPYICSVCSVAFYRNDLLKRHATIHSAVESSNSRPGDEDPENEDQTSQPRKRRRTRTACNSCRTAKAKCIGDVPCRRCVDHEQQCVFENRMGRVSTDLRLNIPVMGTYSPPQTDPEAITDAFLETANEIWTNTGSTSEECVEQETLTCDDMHLAPAAPDPSMPGGTLFADDPVYNAWPWRHEDMFLQDFLNIDWPEFPHSNIGSSNGQTTNSLNPDVLSIQHVSASSNALPSRTTTPLAGEDMEAGDPSISNSRATTITRLVQEATNAVEIVIRQPAMVQHTRNEFYKAVRNMCTEIGPLFGLSRSNSDFSERSKNPSHFLDDYVVLYLENFWTLWPLFPRYECFEFKSYQPLLYLTLASIGAMYGGKKASQFGSLLHIELRDILIRPWFDHIVSESEALPLGQARSLTQAAALYFGQKRAFSYAQHIGAVLLSQGRRMGIFSSTSPQGWRPGDEIREDSVKKWVRHESRKRLSYAIMRLEMYSSALRSVRPLISAEEMDVELPCSRFLWHTEFKSIAAFAAAIEQETQASYAQPIFSDLVRIAVDEKEKLPVLGLLAQELLLNALQEKVWSALVARDSSERLRPDRNVFQVPLDEGFDLHHARDSCVPEQASLQQESNKNPTKAAVVQGSLEGHIARRSRNMSSLHLRNLSITAALRKWQDNCLSAIEDLPSSVPDRSSLLSCLLIYHLSYLQLHAPINLIHTLYHQQPTAQPSVESYAVQRSLKDWITTSRSRAALPHSITIFTLLANEAEKDESTRARVNFLSMIGLYHSAAMVWIYAMMASDAAAAPSSEKHAEAQLMLPRGHGISIIRTNSAELMNAFVKLFDLVSPAWAARSSFCAAVKRLGRLELSEDGGGGVVER